MNIQMMDLSAIKPYEKNPRRNDEAVKYVAESIKEFGFKVPIVIDSDGVVIAGHTRYKAAKKLHMSVVPCIVADDLSEEQIKAFRLADNKVAEKSEWDFDLLTDELGDIFDIDMEAFGFDFEEEPSGEELEDPESSIETDPKIEVKMIFGNLKTWKKYEDTLRNIADEFENTSISVGGDYED